MTDWRCNGRQTWLSVGGIPPAGEKKALFVQWRIFWIREFSGQREKAFFMQWRQLLDSAFFPPKEKALRKSKLFSLRKPGCLSEASSRFLEKRIDF
jgi:hypothetical protein